MGLAIIAMMVPDPAASASPGILLEMLNTGSQQDILIGRITEGGVWEYVFNKCFR